MRYLRTMNATSKGKVVCVGASLVDLTFRCEQEPVAFTSNPARMHRSPGGVVRNIAHHLALLNIPVELVTIFGNDPDGQWLSSQCAAAGIGLHHVLVAEEPTGTFASIATPSGDLHIGAVTSETDRLLSLDFFAQRAEVFRTAALVIADCNLSVEALRWLMRFCNEHNVPLVVETVSIPKARRLRDALPGKLLLVKPNREELAVFEQDTHVTPEEKIAHLHALGFKNVWLSRGAEGSLFSDGNTMVSLPAPRVHVRDVNGAGDASLAGWVYAWMNGKDGLTCVRYGHAAAACLLEVVGAVRSDFSPTLLEQRLS
ncbi:MAG: Pseudouridine kinase [Bacteroidota bacterium]|jgi:pseudouridine kinase